MNIGFGVIPPITSTLDRMFSFSECQNYVLEEVSCKTWNLESGILESWNPGILESSRL